MIGIHIDFFFQTITMLQTVASLSIHIHTCESKWTVASLL